MNWGPVRVSTIRAGEIGTNRPVPATTGSAGQPVVGWGGSDGGSTTGGAVVVVIPGAAVVGVVGVDGVPAGACGFDSQPSPSPFESKPWTSAPITLTR